MKKSRKWITYFGGTFLICACLLSQNKLEGTAADGSEFAQVTSESAIAKEEPLEATFEKKYISLWPGETMKNTIDIKGEYDDLHWHSQNNQYATVDQKGTVHMKKAGSGHKCRISVTISYERQDQEHEKTISYVVEGKRTANELQVSAKQDYVFVGKTLKLAAEYKPKNAAHAQLLWESENEKYAKISQKGKIHPKKAGAGKTVVFTAKTTEGPHRKAKIAIRIIDPKKPMVALTFDDGPSVEYTSRIVKQLKNYEARATFFVVGSRIGGKEGNKLLKKSADYGNEIASHTYSHSNLASLSVSRLQQEDRNTRTKIEKITGQKVLLTRPPYGSYSDTVKATVQTPLILWSIDTRDWQTRNCDLTVQKVMSAVKDGDIILMHDIYSTTASAAEQIIPQLAKRGFQMVTVSELATYKKAALKAGSAYSSIR